jgi:hypothetical protein
MREAFAHGAVVVPAAGSDQRAPGAAVTLALCGALDHPPPCPLAPHHTSVEPDGSQLRVRVLFVTDAAREPEVRRAINAALASGSVTSPDEVVSRWSLVSSSPERVRDDEREHAARLAVS